MSRRVAAIVAGLAGSLAGCSVGPDYRLPETAMPAHFARGAAPAQPARETELAEWWRAFGDPRLDALVERALRANHELRAAGARVRAARALRGAAVADLLPTAGAGASLTTARRSASALAFRVQFLDTDTYQAGFDATWELDVFGGKRRALEAAGAELSALEEDQRTVLVSLLGEVARNYVELRTTQKRLAIARANLAAQRQMLEITEARLHAGLASALDTAQARALLATTQAQTPALEAALEQSSHRLCVLVGAPPGALDAELAEPAPIPAPPPDVPPGLPADLLRRRPDVRRIERQLAAATARVGVAKGEFFPKFFLTGSAGYQSLEAGSLISPASKYWSAGPSLRWRLLEFPRLKALMKAQTAVREQMLAQFDQAVLTALEEVENALVAYAKEKERYGSLSESVAASRQALALANDLYAKGLGEFLAVLLAEGALHGAQEAQVSSERALAEDVIALYKALGGGWASTPNTGAAHPL